MTQVPSEAIRTLMEVGMMAAGNGMFKQAFAVFDGIEAVRPDSEHGFVGVALINMNMGNYDEAVTVLREGALQKSPDSLEAKMILSMALRLAKRGAECEAVMKELRDSGDEAARNFADALSARD